MLGQPATTPLHTTEIRSCIARARATRRSRVGSLPAESRCVVSLRKGFADEPFVDEFHKIWIEQCAATEDIREQFGTKNALDYLIGEKLFTFVEAAEQDSEFAAKLPAFVAAVQRLFIASPVKWGIT